MVNTLQAAASQLPIISLENIGFNDIIQKDINGKTIKQDDNEALAQAIISLYKDKRQCRKLGQAAEKIYRENFMLDNMLNNINALLNK